MSYTGALLVVGSTLLVVFGGTLSAAIPAGSEGFKTHVTPFFKDNCIKCHGPEKSKGMVSLHALDGDLAAGRDMERWEKIMEVLKSGDMPPEDERQPEEAKRRAVGEWIERGLRENIAKANQEATAPTARRLTNFEYENTMRDLLGVDLRHKESLPEDPVKPYHFNNAAEFMLVGPEQIERYLECARRAMASVIVDPVKPEVRRERREWKPTGVHRGMGLDEVGILGNRRGSAVEGMAIDNPPKTGEFRIRLKASAILPAGVRE
ncbi:MAG: DUF1587 domain-containing protein, partial [Opitutaceae bacterium]|nr:DUF1587 domain-containing protein [Verrucomicrobiales bacterium]